MTDFMAQRIIDGAQDYAFVINKRPDLKDGIDAYLVSRGHQELITK